APTLATENGHPIRGRELDFVHLANHVIDGVDYPIQKADDDVGDAAPGIPGAVTDAFPCQAEAFFDFLPEVGVLGEQALPRAGDTLVNDGPGLYCIGLNLIPPTDDGPADGAPKLVRCLRSSVPALDYVVPDRFADGPDVAPGAFPIAANDGHDGTDDVGDDLQSHLDSPDKLVP